MFDIRGMPGGEKMAKKKKWGSVGAPKSAKRRAHMKKIAKKR